MKFAVTQRAVEAIKSDLRERLPLIKSSHRSEAIARGLGWRTNAAMRVSLAGGDAERVMDADSFVAYLRGHDFDADGRHFARAGLRVQVRAVMEAHEQLTSFGFGVYQEGRISVEEWRKRYAESRAEMLSDAAVEEFERAIEFLGSLELTRRPRVGSRPTT